MVTSRDSNGVTMQLPHGCLTIYTLSHWVIRAFPLSGVKVFHPAQMLLTRPPARRPPKRTELKKVSRLSSSRNDWRVLQRRYQPTPFPFGMLFDLKPRGFHKLKRENERVPSSPVLHCSHFYFHFCRICDQIDSWRHLYL